MSHPQSTKEPPRNKSGWKRLFWNSIFVLICLILIPSVLGLRQYLIIKTLEKRGVQMNWTNVVPEWFGKYISPRWALPISYRLISLETYQRSDSKAPVYISDSELRALGKQELLSVLTVPNSPITDAGMQSLGPMPYLHELDLTGTFVSELNWIDPVQMISLKYADLSGTKLNDNGLERLANMAILERLDLSNTIITGSGLSSICRSKSLRELTLSQTSITDEDLKTVSTMSQLEILRLCKTRVTGSGLKDLRPLTTLFEIDLSDSEFRDEEAASLKRLMCLRTLKLNRTALTNQGLAKLTLVPTLHRLFVQETQVTLAGLKPLGNLKDLKLIMISNPEPLIEDDVQTLKPFYYLETLHIWDTSATPEIIELLASLPCMEDLTFYNSRQRIPQKDLEEIQTRHSKVQIRFVDQ